MEEKEHELIDLARIAELSGAPLDTAHQWTEDVTSFPRPVKVGAKRKRFWLKAEIDLWLKVNGKDGKRIRSQMFTTNSIVEKWKKKKNKQEKEPLKTEFALATSRTVGMFAKAVMPEVIELCCNCGKPPKGKNDRKKRKRGSTGKDDFSSAFIYRCSCTPWTACGATQANAALLWNQRQKEGRML